VRERVYIYLDWAESPKLLPMIAASYDRDEEVTYLRVPLDDATFAWVIELAESCHVEPSLVISSILRDVRVDDETEHLCEPRRSGGGIALN
jgi:hypothetical protein